MKSAEDSQTSAELSRCPSLFKEIQGPMLRAAVRRLKRTSIQAGQVGVTDELLAVTASLEGDETALDGLSQSSLAISLNCLDQLRAEVLRAWSTEQPPVAVASVLPMLEAFDRVRLWLDSRIEFRGQHLPPSGMNLAAEVAHDLRSPLTSILFLADTLRSGQSGELNDLQHRQVGLIYSAALGIMSLASNLIELAQGGEGLLEQQPAAFSITETIGSICDIVRPIAEEKKLTLRVLPLAVDHRVGFPAALSRVLLNLVTNALQYTEEGFVEISVRSKGGTSIEFSVRDSGTGLDQEARQALFDPFRRVRKGMRYGFSGSGLGLAICSRLLKVMDSELQFETAEGWGTRFYFDLDLPPA
jgi:signal transduction histidine kinase